MIRSNITDGLGRLNEAEVTNDNALKVKTLDYFKYENSVRFFINDINGQNLNVNASPSGGILENIHDGEDNTYWTPSIIESFGNDFTFDSTDQNFTPGGAQSFQYADTEDGDIAQWLRPSGLLNMSSYNLLSGWIYLTLWPGTGTKNILFYCYDTNLGLTIGNSINLSDYINISNLNSWQSFNIPLVDMGVTTQSIDSIRTELVDGGAGAAPQGYLDDFILQGVTVGQGPYDYILTPNKEEKLIVHTLTITISRPYDSTIANGTMPGLSYNDILGFLPTFGIFYQRVSNNELIFNITFNNLIDFLSVPNLTITDFGYDGTNTFLKMEYNFTQPIELLYSSRDYISFRIIDDFSSFLNFRISAGCKSINENEG